MPDGESSHSRYETQVVQLYSCLDKISYVEWAPDSEYILCGLFKKALVQAWSVSQPEWTCKIDDGSVGICHARYVSGLHCSRATFYLEASQLPTRCFTRCSTHLCGIEEFKSLT